MQRTLLAESEGLNLSAGPPPMPYRIPDIDYARHPAYGAQFGQPTLGERINALRWLLPTLLGFTALEARQAVRRLMRGKAQSAIDPKFAERGFLLHRFRPEAKQALMDALKEQRATLEARLEAVAPAERHYNDAQLIVQRADAESAYRILEEELRRLGVMELSKAYISGSAGLVKYFVLQINDEGESHWRQRFKDAGIADSPANYFHIDTGVGVMKTIVYLSEVGPDSGATSYVPGSHRMSRSTIDSIIRSAVDTSGIGQPDPKARRAFRALPRFLQRKADFGKDVFDVTEPARVLLDNEVVATSNIGDVLVFDNMGIHRGGMVRKGRRMILQVVLH